MKDNIIEKVKEEITFENVLATAMKAPGVKVNRVKFLRKELKKYCSDDVISSAINSNPAKAGIPRELIDKISKQIINYETTKVTGISMAASIPGGAAAVGAAAADITSYFAFILRTVQELAYLYGFEQFDLNDDEVDAETMNTVLLFIGVMFGVQGAASTLQKFANVLAKQISKKLAQKALTKGTIYPIVKKVATSVGIRMTKQIFADTVASAVPILGGALSGGLTYAMFRPGCMKLRRNLRSYNLCNPEFYKSASEEPDKEVIDVEFVETDSIDNESE
ncbi:EcsC family protein [Butyricicoccus pullicaecorum]|jgi:hypothetical protein|nr:EcsC family protein [Butyricicoccus pullicaecorum]